jgi:hypothetical protein
MEFVGASQPLSVPGLTQCIDLLGVGAAEVWTLLAVETKGCGFLPDRRPVILFERHIFRKQTGCAFDLSHPSISSSTPGGYLGKAREYDRLQQAAALNRTAALHSASWGIGQIVGFNAHLAGYSSVEAMIEAMLDGEDAQLAAMARFLRAKKLHLPLAKHDWSAFARGYNGPAFHKNHYDTRLAASYAAFATGLFPDIKVRQAQVLLMFLGIDAGTIDGIAGKRTGTVVSHFRQQHGLASSEVVDDALIASLLQQLDQPLTAVSHR